VTCVTRQVLNMNSSNDAKRKLLLCFESLDLSFPFHLPIAENVSHASLRVLFTSGGEACTAAFSR